MKSWEYKIIVRRLHAEEGWSWVDQVYDGKNGGQVLNEMGSQGWDLVNALPIAGISYVGNPVSSYGGTTDCVHYIFKRELI